MIIVLLTSEKRRNKKKRVKRVDFERQNVHSCESFELNKNQGHERFL